MTTTLARLDKRKPHKEVVNFTTGTRTYYQNGQAFAPSGVAVVDAAGVAARYLCPKCDFATVEAPLLYGHVDALHHGSDAFKKVLDTYIENIDRGLPADEGIDWRMQTVTRTPAQTAFDAREEKLGKKIVAAAPAGLAHACDKCPSTFKNQQGLAAHMRRHR